MGRKGREAMSSPFLPSIALLLPFVRIVRLRMPALRIFIGERSLQWNS